MVKKLLALAFILLAGSAEAQVNWGAYGPGPTPTGIINTNMYLPATTISGNSAPTTGAILGVDGSAAGTYLYWGTRGSTFLGTVDTNGVYPNPSGNFNTGIGMRAGANLGTGHEDVCVGAQTCQWLTTGNFNAAVGDNALGGIDTGSTSANGSIINSVGVGFQAGYSLGGGATDDVVIGDTAAGSATTASELIAIGSSTVGGLSGSALTGSFNIGIGYQAFGNLNGSATTNLAIGDHAGLNTSTASNDVFLGSLAGDHVTTGANEVCVGYQACLGTGSASTTGANNTVVGNQAGLNLQGAVVQNTLIGDLAGSNLTTGGLNVAVGDQAGRFITGGVTANQTSQTSVYLGAQTKANANGDSNEIVVGYQAVGNGSNTTTIGNASITGTYIPGIAVSTAADVLCYATLTGLITYEPTGTTCTVSAARFKNFEGIIDNAEPMIGSLHIRTGHFKKEFQKDYGTSEHVWIIADEVCKADERLCARDKDGKVRSYDRDGVLAYVVRDLQQQHEEIAHLTTELSHLRHKHR